MMPAIATIAAQRAVWYSRIALGRARRVGRAGAAAIGLPVRKEFVIVDCADGADASGLFSEAAAVVGCLADVDAHPELYGGMRVDFADHGLYYDASIGPNWWEYFFEPLVIGETAARGRVLSDWEHDAYAATVELHMARADAARLVQRHVVPRATLAGEVERFWHSHFDGVRAIGVHYRGTDKWEGAPVVPLEAVAQAVIDASLAGGGDPWKLFLATDEQACVEFMRRRFPDRTVAQDVARSTDGRPLHKTPGHGYRKGAEAVTDCLLLSRTSHLVRTDSDLGLFATFFNPSQSVRMFGQPT